MPLGCQLCHFQPNSPVFFPFWELTQPGPILLPNGTEECHVNCILDEKKVGWGKQYLVAFKEWGPEHNTWLPEVNYKTTKPLICGNKKREFNFIKWRRV